MSSKNPNSEIAAKIVLDGGYDPCKTFPEDNVFWTKNPACDPGLPQVYFNGSDFGAFLSKPSGILFLLHSM